MYYYQLKKYKALILLHNKAKFIQMSENKLKSV